MSQGAGGIIFLALMTKLPAGPGRHTNPPYILRKEKMFKYWRQKIEYMAPKLKYVAQKLKYFTQIQNK